MQKEKWEMYQKKFKDFEATKVVENEQLLVMDWKNKNGSSEFATRYTLDKENGSLVAIDLHGNYTASWCNLLPAGKKVLDYEYFKEKIRGQIEDYRHRNEELIPILKKYNEDPQRLKGIPLNKCILNRMLLLAVGFQMAVDGLSKTSQENNVRYFEVSMKRTSNPSDEYSLCILGIRKPTYVEAKEFCKSDLENFQYDYISDIREITKEEAYDFFDMDDEEKFPIFGK